MNETILMKVFIVDSPMFILGQQLETLTGYLYTLVFKSLPKNAFKIKQRAD